MARKSQLAGKKPYATPDTTTFETACGCFETACGCFETACGCFETGWPVPVDKNRYSS
jgi:hypothetical protein